MRRVAQHDAAQVARCLRGVDRAAKALLIQQRQVAGVIHVRVRDEHELDLCRRDGDGDILEQIAPLLHAAVDQAVVPPISSRVQLPVTSWSARINVSFMCSLLPVFFP